MRKLEDNVKVNMERDWIEWELCDYLPLLHTWGEHSVVPEIIKYHGYNYYTSNLCYN